MKKQWEIRPEPDGKKVSELAKQLEIGDLLVRLLVQRGVDDLESAKRFFRPELTDLHDPFELKDMEKAVDRLIHAFEHKEKILVYGDYDVDGTTAVTMVYHFLTGLNLPCEFYIPDRYTEGYGFSFAGVDYAEENGIGLIITLDCGIRDHKKIAYANDKKIDVIVCDHHNPDGLPPALAVLDPKRPDCPYPNKGLSGCGVGFKLLQGFCRKTGMDEAILYEYLDLLTISIGADIVPLTDENRVLAYYGLQRIAVQKRPGVEAMLFQAGFKKRELTITDVVFVLAPRINAAGRIYSGKQAVELLLAKTFEEAIQLSPALEENNKTRRNLDKEITAEAITQASSDPSFESRYSLVVADSSWHKGVVGIVASRLVEAFYKPSIVLVKDGEKLSGSARSVDGVDLFEALGKCSEFLDQFGGHAMAAGLSMQSSSLHDFSKKFDFVVGEMLDHEMPRPKIVYDAEISFDDINPRFFRILKQFAPFGPGNMNPIFLVRNARNARFTKRVGETLSHLKLHVNQIKNLDIEMDGIAFNLGDWNEHMQAGSEVDLLFTIEENEFRGNVTLQLNVKDIHESETIAD